MIALLLIVIFTALNTLVYAKQGFWSGLGCSILLFLVWAKIVSQYYGA